jgi:hypothetical protein
MRLMIAVCGLIACLAPATAEPNDTLAGSNGELAMARPVVIQLPPVRPPVAEQRRDAAAMPAASEPGDAQPSRPFRRTFWIALGNGF